MIRMIRSIPLKIMITRMTIKISEKRKVAKKETTSRRMIQIMETTTIQATTIIEHTMMETN